VAKGDFNEYYLSDIPENLRLINITGEYQTVEIDNTANSVPYRFEIRLKYGEMDFNRLDFEENLARDGEKYYKGFYGIKTAKALVYIDLEYGEILIKN
jgi:hypothetical protein